MYHVYILRCKDNSLYTGITTDLDRRFREHANGKGGHYTKSRKAAAFIYSEGQPNRSEALKREAEIKRLSREEKLKLIAANKI